MLNEKVDVRDHVARYETIQRLGLLGTRTEEAFARLTRLTANLLGVPGAIIIVFDTSQHVLKSCLGVPEQWSTLRECPLDAAICRHVLEHDAPLSIDDTRTHPLVQEPHRLQELGISAYAAVPLRSSDGQVLGACCAIDHEPRAWSADQLQLLHDLAATTMAKVELLLVAREPEQQPQQAVAQYREDERLVQEPACQPHTLEHQHGESMLLLERITDGFLALDTSWRFTYVNNLVERLTGRSRAALLGKHIWEVFPEASGTIIEDEYRRAMATQTPRFFEVFYEPYNRWLAIRAYPSSEGLSVYYQDTTEQKRIEQLRQGQLQILEMIANGKELSAILEALALLVEGQAEGMLCSILLVDESGTRLREGAAPSLPQAYNRAIDGVAICDSIGPCSTAAFLREPVILEDIAALTKWGFFRETALAFNLRACWSTPIVAQNGQVLGSYAMYWREPRTPGANDQQLITFATYLAGIAIERKQVEGERQRLLNEEQAAREEAEKALQVREQFFSLAAHELKTPVTTLLGYSQFLLRRTEREGASGAKDQRILGTLLNQVQRLHRLTTSLLDLSRLQSGQLTLELELIDLTVLTQELVSGIVPTLSRHTLELVLPAEQLLLKGDCLRLEQMLYNLLENAVKYSPEGGPVRVTVEQQVDGVSIAVQDHGIGIPHAELPYIFDRFYRSSNINSQQISGMGIGLFVTQEIIARHGGTITVQSEDGRGSTFTVWLPYQGAAAGVEAA